MSTYYEKLRDPRWQKRRLEIMKRDGFACRDCGDSKSTLNVHHCHYAKTPWEANEKVLLTVCEDCHATRQSLEDDCRHFLGLIFAKIANHPDDDALSILAKDMHVAANSDEVNIRIISEVALYQFIERRIEEKSPRPIGSFS